MESVSRVLEGHATLVAAAVIVAEIGGDMTHSPSAGSRMTTQLIPSASF